MPDPLRHVRALTEEIGPRPAASAGEARAARYIAEAARGFTHQVWLEQFPTFLHAHLAYELVGSVALLGVLLLSVVAPIGAAVLTLAAVAGAGQALHWIDLGWLFRRHESRNVVAVVPSAESIRRRMVLVAHTDSAQGDDSGGPAVALAAGELLAQAPLRHTEVWTVFTGAKEPGWVGLQAFLQRYGPMLADADFVVLDRLGGGDLRYALAEGLFPLKAADPDLTGCLAELASRHPEWGLRSRGARRRETQAACLLESGHRAVSLASSRGGRAAPRVLHNAVRVLGALAAEIDRDACIEAEADQTDM